MQTVVAPPTSPADSAYLEALDAWDEGRWDDALAGARAALALEPGHGPAQLLEAYALIRGGSTRAGMDALDRIVHDDAIEREQPEVARLAAFVIRRYADRWSRDDWGLAGGPSWRDSRAYDASTWAGGFAFEGTMPLTHRISLRADLTTPFASQDTLAVSGPQWSVLAVWQQPLGMGILHVDAALGPSVWTGRSAYWDHRYRGAFPGARAALALDWRTWQYTGFRVEAGYTAHYGARQGLGILSYGAEIRVMATGYGR
jgi:hypothetical protein